jgi:N-acetylneuraminic acid mutarotase
MRSENGKFNDLHWFDAKSMSWEKVSETTGDVPPERGGCTFLTLGHKVIVFGGRAQNDVSGSSRRGV